MNFQNKKLITLTCRLVWNRPSKLPHTQPDFSWNVNVQIATVWTDQLTTCHDTNFCLYESTISFHKISFYSTRKKILFKQDQNTPKNVTVYIKKLKTLISSPFKKIQRKIVKKFVDTRYRFRENMSWARYIRFYEDFKFLSIEEWHIRGSIFSSLRKC